MTVEPVLVITWQDNHQSTRGAPLHPQKSNLHCGKPAHKGGHYEVALAGNTCSVSVQAGMKMRLVEPCHFSHDQIICWPRLVIDSIRPGNLRIRNNDADKTATQGHPQRIQGDLALSGVWPIGNSSMCNKMKANSYPIKKTLQIIYVTESFQHSAWNVHLAHSSQLQPLQQSKIQHYLWNKKQSVPKTTISTCIITHALVFHVCVWAIHCSSSNFSSANVQTTELICSHCRHAIQASLQCLLLSTDKHTLSPTHISKSYPFMVHPLTVLWSLAKG